MVLSQRHLLCAVLTRCDKACAPQLGKNTFSPDAIQYHEGEGGRIGERKGEREREREKEREKK
jgi:hypothetical protein